VFPIALTKRRASLLDVSAKNGGVVHHRWAGKEPVRFHREVTQIDYETFFKQRLDELRAEGRYCLCADSNRAAAASRTPTTVEIGSEVTV
jgi:hypothetical protein